ncbi:uncharacterized protein [Antedon mediterranea]|uniref:uncharacterized protein isoform X2 n=1 Tax=Antedon mediterranea TaxID=105859 RepID=UPI003AF69480
MPPKARKRIKDKGDASNSQNGKSKTAKSDKDSNTSSSSLTKFLVLSIVVVIVGCGVAVHLGYIDIQQLQQEFNGASDSETDRVLKDTEKAPEPKEEKITEPKKEKKLEPKKEKAPEPKKEKTPEPKKEKAPEPKKEKAPEPKKEKAPEPKKEKAPEPKKEKAPEPKKEKAPEPKKEKAPEPKKEKAPDPKKEKAPEPKKEKAPEPKKEKAPEPKKEKAPEPKKEKAPEPKKEKAPEPKKEKAPEPKKDKAPEPKKEKAPEPKKEKAPEPKKEKAPAPKKEPEPKKEKTPEAKKEKAPEPKKEKAPEPKKEKAPEPKKDKAPEPKKEKAPEAKKEKQEPKEDKIPELNEKLDKMEKKVPKPIKESESKKSEGQTPDAKKEKVPESKKEKKPEPKKEKETELKKEKAPEPKKEDQLVAEEENKKKRKKNSKEEILLVGRTNTYDKAIEKELDLCEDLIVQKKYESALRRFEKLLTTHPASPRARLGRANALYYIADEQRSNDLLKSCISAYDEVAKAPNCPNEVLKEAMIAQADRLRFLGNSMKSISVLEDLNKRIPNDITVLRELGVTYLIKGNNNAAKPIFQKILEVVPSDGHAKVHLGFILKSETKYEESIPLLTEGIATEEEGTKEGKYYFHLGDALYRLGRVEQAYEVYSSAAKKGFFLSKWQRSLYNVDSLTAKPWWTPDSAKVAKFIKLLEDNWQVIRDEGVANMDPKTGSFVPEVENLRESGDWKQFTLYTRGKRNDANCKRAPKTCEIIDQIPMATSNKRGQVKFSVLHPGTHIWAHCGPTNCRLRSHLGLVVPDGLRIRVKDQTRKWQEGKMLIFDDSFEHEVWHDGDSFRLILIVDFWHPELTESQRRKLTAI